MGNASDSSDRDLLAHVLLPVANRKDAEATARALEPYGPDRVTALHVVEKAGGAPDKTPVEQSKREAQAAFGAVRTVFPDAEERVDYARDVPGAIFDAATAVDASAIVYRSRGGHRLMHFLSGDLSLKLVTASDVPVVALPARDD